jgi:Mn-dependent DtxR family transcriptional regulator
MSTEATVLRAMLRLARRREAAEEEALAVRVGSHGARLRAMLRRLEAAGLVELRADQPPRLTMAGLAVAVGALPAPATRSARRTGPDGGRSRAA